MGSYWASCATGLQFCLRSELESLESTEILSDSLTYGGIIFQTKSQPEEVLKLRSADNVYAFLGHYKDVPVDKDGSVEYFRSLAEKIDWDPPMSLYRLWHKGRTAEMSSRSAISELSFRVTSERICMKMKKHGYTSMDAAAAIGDGIQDLLGWKANMRGFKVEVVAWIVDMELLLLLSLIYSDNRTAVQSLCDASKGTLPKTDQSEAGTDQFRKGGNLIIPRPSRSNAQLHSHRKYRKSLVVTSLKPSTAFALLQLAQIQPGHVILDPMCGCGTIPLEAADCYGGLVMALAGDISSRAVSAAAVNTAGRQTGGPCDVLQWTAGNLPLRTGSVDRILSDMPFGVNCGNSKMRELLGPMVVQEVVRVLRPGTGLAVLMAHGKAMRQEMECNQKPFLELLQHLYVVMEGISVEVYVVQRTRASHPQRSVDEPTKQKQKKKRRHRKKSLPSKSVSIPDS